MIVTTHLVWNRDGGWSDLDDLARRQREREQSAEYRRQLLFGVERSYVYAPYIPIKIAELLGKLDAIKGML